LGGECRTEVESWRAGLGWQKVLCSGEGSRKGQESGGCLGSSLLEINPFMEVWPMVLNNPKPGHFRSLSCSPQHSRDSNP